MCRQVLFCGLKFTVYSLKMEPTMGYVGPQALEECSIITTIIYMG